MTEPKNPSEFPMAPCLWPGAEGDPAIDLKTPDLSEELAAARVVLMTAELELCRLEDKLERSNPPYPKAQSIEEFLYRVWLYGGCVKHINQVSREVGERADRNNRTFTHQRSTWVHLLRGEI